MKKLILTPLTCLPIGAAKKNFFFYIKFLTGKEKDNWVKREVGGYGYDFLMCPIVIGF